MNCSFFSVASNLLITITKILPCKKMKKVIIRSSIFYQLCRIRLDTISDHQQQQGSTNKYQKKISAMENALALNTLDYVAYISYTFTLSTILFCGCVMEEVQLTFIRYRKPIFVWVKNEYHGNECSSVIIFCAILSLLWFERFAYIILAECIFIPCQL